MSPLPIHVRLFQLFRDKVVSNVKRLGCVASLSPPYNLSVLSSSPELILTLGQLIRRIASLQGTSVIHIFFQPLQWTYPQHGAKLVPVDVHFQHHKHTQTMNAHARRRRSGLLVLWERPKRSGNLKSDEEWKRRPQFRSWRIHQTWIRSPNQFQTHPSLKR